MKYLRLIRAFLRKEIGRVLWYFIYPYADNLCDEYTIDLVDRDELDSEISNIQHDIRIVERDIEELRAEL